MRYVIDASTALGFVLPDETDDRSGTLLDSLERDSLLVPSLWYAETLNGLIQAQRRKRIDGAAVDRAIGYLHMLDIHRDPSEPDMLAVRRLAEPHRLTAYDAIYLELALRSQLPLATRDAALAKAARAHRVQLL